MASEIRVDKINSLSGVGTVTLSPTGVDIAGITTAATLRATTGIVTSLTAGSLTSLGAVSGTTGTFSGGRINGTLTYITGFSNLNSQLNIYFGGAGTYVHIFHMNSINPTSAIENVTRSNIGDNTTIRGHAIYYVD